MALEAMDRTCLRLLRGSNKSKFDSYSVRNSVLIISHITFRDCRVHIFSHNLSRNSCIRSYLSAVLVGICAIKLEHDLLRISKFELIFDNEL